MIIELFGPPGAGKTTLAYALARRLQQRGHRVDLMLSCRPAEYRSRSNAHSHRWLGLRGAAVPRRLTRPLLELLAIACQPFSMSDDIGITAGLLKILPPEKVAVAIRLSQYILRLSHCWCRASAMQHTAVLDQAFVQLICSLALFSRSADQSLIAQALDFSPRADLFVRLDAPPHLLMARLQERQRRQSPTERLFELNVDTNLKSIVVIDQLDRLLRDRGEPVIRAISADQCSLSESVAAIEAMVTARSRAAGQVTWQPGQRAITPTDKVAT
jgi:thymidylate kinase